MPAISTEVRWAMASHARRGRRALRMFGFGAVAFAAATALAWTVQAAWIGTGFFAKSLCSGVFVSGRDPHAVVERDLRWYSPAPLFRAVAWTLDREGARVTASWLGLVRREARFRAGGGCALFYPDAPRIGAAVAAPPATSAALAARRTRMRELRRSDAAPPALAAVIDAAFDDPHADRPRGTRAVVVVRDGRILAERYAEGFDRETRFPGWSLSKSVVNALVGVLAQQGLLRLSDPVSIPEWRAPADPRAALTYDALLRMSSGLAFDEAYGDPYSDVARMLFATPDAAAYASAKPLVATPGSVWAYASGTTSVLVRALRAFERPDLPYADMPRRLLFERIGMASALVETDQSGNPLGASAMFATALDWARFGWLYAADGVWRGERILPAGWVEYTATPAPADRHGQYGAHFWLYDAHERAAARAAAAAEIPRDAFFAGGFGGQRITIVPSARVVVVRLGQARDERSAFDNAAFVARVLEALEDDRARDRVHLAGHRPGGGQRSRAH